MIKIDKVEVFGFEAAIRGCRNPMNSWDKSDSHYGCYMGHNQSPYDCSICTDDCMAYKHNYIIGPNDLTLMKKLVKAGNDHSKFMRMINVTMDITAPLYWWKEADTYVIGKVQNSCSTMHKIHAKEFTLDDFSCEHLTEKALEDFEHLIGVLNYYRRAFVEQKEKVWWWNIIQLLPSSYNQKRTIQLNYAVLRNMYHSRKNHKLDCWRDFCKWVETLPYSELIVC